ncbi:MAG: hypothetical protein HQL81_01665 [Magnetococcales bacterium]|nr:hypothetical protein [Magnetococcales bacterium]
MTSKPTTHDTANKKSGTFPDEVMLRYRIANAIQSAGRTKLAKNFLDLLRLKEELDLFISDIVALGRQRRIIYAVDDVVLQAYVEMDKNNRRSFSFPITEHHENDEQLKLRATEYAWRLKSLFFSRNRPNEQPPLLILPSAMPGLTGFAEFIGKNGRRSNETISSKFDEILEQEPETIKQALEELVRTLSLHPLGRKIEQRGKAADNATTYLSDNLYSLYQAQWNLEQTGHYVNLFKKMLTEGHFCYAQTGLSCVTEYLDRQFQSDPVAKLIPETIAALEPMLADAEPYDSQRVDRLFQLLLESDKESVYETERKPESLWISATNFGYLSAINQTFEKNGINAEVQLITHRQKLVNAVRALGWEKKGAPFRHPKFLAAAIEAEKRQDTVGLANKIVIFLERMIGEINKIALKEKNNEWSASDLGKTQSAVEQAQKDITGPWGSMKSCIYLNEIYTDPQCHTHSKPIRRRSSNINQDILDRFELRYEELQEIAKSSVNYEGEYLLHQILDQRAVGQKVFVAHVPDFEGLEMEHVMIVPIAMNLRHIIKIPFEFFRNDSPVVQKLTNNSGNESELIEMEIIEIINSIDTQNQQLYSFSRALCASVSGYWTLVEQLLEGEGNHDTKAIHGLMESKQFLAYEGFHLRQFGLRGTAAKTMTHHKTGALAPLNKAGLLLQTMTQNVDEDVRYRLARIGWNLEVLSTLVEINEREHEYEQIMERYPSFRHIEQPDVLVNHCLVIIETLSNRVKNNVTKDETQKASSSQEFYWHYMLGRTYQMIMMAMAMTKANLVPDSMTATYAFRYRVNNPFSQTEKGLESWATAMEQLEKMTQIKMNRKSIKKTFPATNFLHHWYRLQTMECLSAVDPHDLNSVEELKRAKQCIHDVMELFEEMEKSCRQLSPSGFARRVFRRLKAVEYAEQREKMNDLLFRAMTRLEREAAQSYQNW